MEAVLEKDLARVDSVLSSAITEEEIMRITLIPRDGGAPFSIEVRPGQPFLPTVQDALEDPRAQAWHGGDEITDSEATFGEYGIEDGARITVAANAELTAEEVAEEFVACNPGNPEVTVEKLFNGMYCTELGDERPRLARNADGSVKDWNCSYMGLVAVPDIICSLRISGSLRLDGNKLSTVPAGFGSITVGRHLKIKHQSCKNKILNMPESFPNVGGKIF
jgi:hypothetical protein